ncbi:hypothetical protein LHK_01947 [Laribacter hongkongensis HLHK9]|uniref:Uncharacterized protein n=1 Tax=Laribacter hongkongensis (strain HLHK9) TaxID=557598 RepID=C1D8Z2_LARHH|nr:hypothetical protein [Laribacter hongkongensis]ACO74931.1 hypothetical protein LHK_01947 [Laribacter hongkongensis HLHK9]
MPGTCPGLLPAGMPSAGLGTIMVRIVALPWLQPLLDTPRAGPQGWHGACNSIRHDP